jgi:hypothetical protein
MRQGARNEGLSRRSAEHRMLTVLVLRILSKTPYRHPPMCYVLSRMAWSWRDRLSAQKTFQII